MATQTGYKASELGMIPQNWDVVELGSIGEPIIGLTYSPRDINDNGILVLRSSNIHSNKLRFDNNVFVKMEIPERVIVKENDILICVRNGSRQLIGKCALITKEAEGFAFGAFMSVFRTLFAPFVFYTFQSDKIQNQIKEIMGATINQITNKDLREFKIAIPKSITEQTAIATALSDTDALISSLQTLITKKQAIKLSAMQNLLSGKIRLPEFAKRPDGSLKTTRQTELGCVPEDWEVVELEKVAEIKSGGTPSTNRSEFWNGHILWCTPTDITSLSGKYLSDTNRKITEMGLNNSAAELLPTGSVLMTSRATIGECAIAKRPMTTNQGFKNFICNRTVNNEFLYYLLSSQKDKFIELCNGSTFLEISTTQVRKFKITIPKSTTEQTSIAQLLSDMDAEIEALECRLKKTQALKQGMMQALLTGKIRLPLE